jgi:hypothetical protein
MPWWAWLAAGVAGWIVGNALLVALFAGAAKAERMWREAQAKVRRIPQQRAVSPVARPALRRVK